MAGAAVAGVGMLSWTVGFEPHWFEVVETKLPLAGLPASLVGKRVVQLSDLHVGAADLDYLASTLRHVNALRPDVVVFTGDFINHDYTGNNSDLAKVMTALAPAPLGAFACLGNHDYGRRWKDVALADRVAVTLHGAGVKVLRDEAVDVAGLTIVGLNDLWCPRFGAIRVLSQFDGSRGALCLCHNPDTCDMEVWGNFRGQILSGHTHGGQCKPPFLPPPMLPVNNRSYVAGHYDLGRGRSLYINRGVGHTRQVRFNCRPEVTLFTLERA